MTINASGCLMDGLGNGMQGIVGTVGVQEKIMTFDGDPSGKLTALIGGSTVCADINTPNLFINDPGDSGSSWVRLVSGT